MKLREAPQGMGFRGPFGVVLASLPVLPLSQSRNPIFTAFCCIQEFVSRLQNKITAKNIIYVSFRLPSQAKAGSIFIISQSVSRGHLGGGADPERRVFYTGIGEISIAGK